MTTYRRSDDDEPPEADPTATDPEVDPTIDLHEIPLGAAIDYAERERGELPERD
jgi:hypothetical protein